MIAARQLRAAFLAGSLLAVGAGNLRAEPPGNATYSVLIMQQPAGQQATIMLPDNGWGFRYEYNDRGRGPKLSSRILLDDDGIPKYVESAGVNYLKAPFEEKFKLEGKKATWKNPSEAGEKSAEPDAFYLSLNGVPQEVGFLAQALLKTPKRKLPLLPEGEASIARGAELELEANGEKKSVVEYLISGLDFTPSPVWLERDGTFFALASGWQTVVRKGWESTVPALLKAQDAGQAVTTAALEKALPHRPSSVLAVTHAALFDSESARLRRGSTVVVEGNRIRSVGPDGETAIPAGAEVIDAKGKTLLPGLWDMHVHLSGDTDGLLHMAAGVTSVRDLANDTERLLEMRRKFDSGESIGPRIVMAGFLDGRGPYAGPTKVFADSEEEAKKEIDNYAKLGYVQIKVYSSIKPELVPAIIRMAHERGLRVSGHVPAFMTAEQFVQDGADEIQHVNFLFLNFLFDTVKDTRTPARFTSVAENAAKFDFASKKFKDFVALLKSHKTVSDPTVVAFEDMFDGRPTTVAPSLAPVAGRLPAQVRRALLNSGLPVPEGKDALYRDSFRALVRMVGELYRAGVTIVAGTDSIAGFALPRELELYTEAGIPAPKVLQIATLGAARVMGQDRTLGSIAPGKLADFILVDGNPTERIGDIRRVTAVVKDGVRYDPAEIYRSLGVKP